MCLTLLSDAPKKLKSYRQRYGWKVFSYNYGKTKLKFETYRHNGRAIVPIDRWLTSKAKTKTFGYTTVRYKPRFHVYLEKPMCIGLYQRIRKVLFKYPVATGRQNRLPVVVATQIKVLSLED